MARACAALAASGAAAATPATPATGPAVAWGACPASWVGEPPEEIAARVQCATLSAPLDHVAPDGRAMSIGVVRVAAALPEERAGAIFFNNGGPGAHPGKLLVSLARGWSRLDSDEPHELDKRRLAERYDLVAVIPRGLVGSGDFRCLTGAPPRYAFLPTNLDDGNWRLAQEEAQSIADACTAPEQARYINTEQHAHDMDMVRRALGDERLHFYGISYGGMVGAWYAATYPDRVDRMLLDSSMDFTRDYRMAARAALEARQRAFHEKAVAPLLAQHARYGLGTDAAAVAAAIDALPSRVRQARIRMESPQDLAATLHVAALLRSDDPPSFESMSKLLRRPLVRGDALLDHRLRMDALWVASKVYEAPAEASFETSPEGDAVRTVVPCNDMAWTRGDDAIRATAGRDATRYLGASGEEILEELVCARWGGPSARTPPLDNLGRVPFLLVHSDNDTSTPLSGASRILDRFASARLLLVRESRLHGVFNFNLSPCVESTAAHYLLTGDLPASPSRTLACDGAQGHPEDAPPGATAASTRPVAVPAPARHDEL